MIEEEENDEDWEDQVHSEFICDFDDIVFHVFMTNDGKMVPTAEKIIGELTKAEVDEHWLEVEAALRKELKSFEDLKVFRCVPRGTTNNCMASRWVFR